MSGLELQVISKKAVSSPAGNASPLKKKKTLCCNHGCHGNKTSDMRSRKTIICHFPTYSSSLFSRGRIRINMTDRKVPPEREEGRKKTLITHLHHILPLGFLQGHSGARRRTGHPGAPARFSFYTINIQENGGGGVVKWLHVCVH